MGVTVTAYANISADIITVTKNTDIIEGNPKCEAQLMIGKDVAQNWPTTPSHVVRRSVVNGHIEIGVGGPSWQCQSSHTPNGLDTSTSRRANQPARAKMQ